MKLPSNALPLPPAYYDKNTGGYWYQDAKGAWVRFPQNDFIRFVKDRGYSGKLADGQTQSDVDRALMKIQMEQNVDYAGSLAGYGQGLIEMEGKAILVTDSPKILQPVAGDFSTLQAVFMGMFGAEQLPYFLSWCKIAYQSMVSGNLRPGHALVLAGPVNSGKSLVQGLITKLLGGRAAHPYLHMTGGTSFNSELFGAEHLVIDDQLGNSDFRTRQKLTAEFKTITAAGSQQCHPKGKPSVTLKPFWRLTVSVNDDPESLLVLPLLKEDLADKVMLFKVEHQTMPMPTGTDSQRVAFWDQLMAEFPHWLDFLVNEWQIPVELQDDRFGVKAFHHPEIVEAIDSLSPEMKLYNLLETQFELTGEAFCGTASKLEALLTGERGNSPYEARKLFSFNTACGVYLARLASKFPAVIRRKERQGNRHLWEIDFHPNRPVIARGSSISTTLPRPILPPIPNGGADGDGTVFGIEVPEPSTWAMLLGGLSLLAFWNWRARRPIKASVD